MNTIDLSRALVSLRPTAQWSLDGEKYEGLIWLDTSPKPTHEELIEEWNRIQPIIIWEEVRNKRNRLLQSTDWAALPDVGINNKQVWLDYRQELRDITTTFSSPSAVVWPDPPA